MSEGHLAVDVEATVATVRADTDDGRLAARARRAALLVNMLLNSVVVMAAAVALPPLKRSHFLWAKVMRCMANGTDMYSKNGGQMSLGFCSCEQVACGNTVGV